MLLFSSKSKRMFSAQVCAFLAGAPAATAALTGCPKPATRWRSGPIPASESRGNAHWRDLLFSQGGNPLEKQENQRTAVGNKHHNHCSTTKYFLSENTWGLLGWPPLENTDCDGNRIFQLNISIAFACSEPRMWKTHSDPKMWILHPRSQQFSLQFSWLKGTLPLKTGKSPLHPLYLSSHWLYGGIPLQKQKHLKNQRWNWQKTEQREEIVIWCSHLLYISFLLREKGKAICRNKSF